MYYIVIHEDRTFIYTEESDAEGKIAQIVDLESVRNKVITVYEAERICTINIVKPVE